MEGQTPTDPAEGQAPDAQATAQTAADKPFDAEYVKSLRAENASYRTKLKDYEKADETRQAASLSELEKAQKAASDADARATALEARMARKEALDALKAAHVIDPDLAYMAIVGQIKMKDGEPENISALVADFVKARPIMVKTPDAKAPEIRATNASQSSPTTPKRHPGRL